jgi:hypothetical protein
MRSAPTVGAILVCGTVGCAEGALLDGANDLSSAGRAGEAATGSASSGAGAAGAAGDRGHPGSGGISSGVSGAGGTIPNPATSDASGGPSGAGDAGGGTVDAGGSAPGNACDPSACSGHGTCTAVDGVPVCACDEGFDAPDCFARNAEYGRRVKVLEGLADPDVLALPDGRYLLSGTGSGSAFDLFESNDLVAWHKVGTFDPSAVDPDHDYCFCWAPDLARVDGTLSLYFSAHRGPKGGTTCPPPTGSDVTTYRAVAPEGSLAFGVPELLFQGQTGARSRPHSGCAPEGCSRVIRIDPAIHDGRLYYVFFEGGNNIASVALADPSDVRVHAGPSGWTLAAYEESINEAPERLEREGQSYLFFSAAWFDSQYATFYVGGASPALLTRNLPVRRLTTPVRRGSGSLIETHGGNSIVTLRGETFNFFHVGGFDASGTMIRRDTYRQRIVWKSDGTAVSQNEVRVSWNALGGGNQYSLDLVLRDGSVIGPCIAVGRIGEATSTTYTGVCPDAGDRLVHKSEVHAFRLYASPDSVFLRVGETPYDGYSDEVSIAAALP